MHCSCIQSHYLLLCLPQTTPDCLTDVMIVTGSRMEKIATIKYVFGRLPFGYVTKSKQHLSFIISLEILFYVMFHDLVLLLFLLFERPPLLDAFAISTLTKPSLIIVTLALSLWRHLHSNYHIDYKFYSYFCFCHFFLRWKPNEPGILHVFA